MDRKGHEMGDVALLVEPIELPLRRCVDTRDAAGPGAAQHFGEPAPCLVVEPRIRRPRRCPHRASVRGRAGATWSRAVTDCLKAANQKAFSTRTSVPVDPDVTTSLRLFRAGPTAQRSMQFLLVRLNDARSSTGRGQKRFPGEFFGKMPTPPQVCARACAASVEAD